METIGLVHKPLPTKLTLMSVLYGLRCVLMVSGFFLMSIIFYLSTLVLWAMNKIGLINDARAALYMCNFASFTMAAFMVNILERILGVELEFSGDELPIGENSILISNHVTNVDFLCIIAYQYRKGMCGHGKFMSKTSLKYIPLFGWACAMMGQVFLKRDWDKDKTKLKETFDFLVESKLPVHLVVFCEGTRITDKKRNETIEFARKKGIEPTSQVLLPRTRGFCAIVNHMRNSHIKYVYDFTIGYVDGPIRMRDLLFSSVSGRKVLLNVKRIAIAQIPQEDEKVQQWLMNRFRRKDKLIANMRENRKFQDEKVLVEPLKFRLVS